MYYFNNAARWVRCIFNGRAGFVLVRGERLADGIQRWHTVTVQDPDEAREHPLSHIAQRLEPF